MLSSGVPREVATRWRESGAGLVIKPLRQSELLEAIEAALTRGRPAPPRTGESPKVVRPSDALAPATGRLRVLLAEDNAVNQLVVVRLLEKHGHSVSVVKDGNDALKALARNAFDVVLMDVHMPEMDGFQATAAIRRGEADGSRRMPIIALTANAMNGDRERCLENGFDDYVPKPVDTRELFAAIGRVAGCAQASRTRTPTADAAVSPSRLQ
jgi:CheY-like chemotaxis protein